MPSQSSANLIYHGQSGALNESYSDFFGAMIDRGNWLIGEALPVGVLRDMCNPTAHDQPDHMNNFSCTTDDGGGVHKNSGIPNKAACLLVDGGTHHGITVNGIGREKAERIYYLTLTRRLVPTSQFNDAAHESIEACHELIGTFQITDADCGEVANAFTAVGIIPRLEAVQITSIVMTVAAQASHLLFSYSQWRSGSL